MVAGISGTGAGSGAAEGDEKDGRLMLLQAPRKIVSAEAIPRLTTVRALRDLTMVPPSNSRPHRSTAKRKTPAGAIMANK
jgi:hypothetical protein